MVISIQNNKNEDYEKVLTLNSKPTPLTLIIEIFWSSLKYFLILVINTSMLLPEKKSLFCQTLDKISSRLTNWFLLVLKKNMS